MSSPFEILGVDSDADDDDVRRAYRRRVKAAHPDHGGSVAEFQRVKAAYEAIRTGVATDAMDVTVDDGGDEAADEERERERVRIEYLNYELLDDYGWSLDDADLFEKAADADLDAADYGRLSIRPEVNLLKAAETCGYTWPYACRGGACANCAVAVVEGEMEMPSNHVLSSELMDRGIRLSCIGVPTTEELKVVYNLKHMPDLDELRLPPQRFERARSTR